jgi:hypothetical protein
MLNAPTDDLVLPEEPVEAELEESQFDKENRLISLNKYLKTQEISKKKISKIKDKFKKKAKTDSRIVTIGKKLYIDLAKYDYSDYSL